jgi:hypothetical protein
MSELTFNEEPFALYIKLPDGTSDFILGVDNIRKYLNAYAYKVKKNKMDANNSSKRKTHSIRIKR